jgi:hypothetical protein
LPIRIKSLSKFKERIGDYPAAEIFYQRRSETEFRIQAGKAAIIATLPSEKEANQLQTWLDSHDAIESEGWIETAELFS